MSTQLMHRQSDKGFTLLEMLLVLFLIGLMASATLMLTEGVEDQAKYDETQRRLSLIRKAIVGDSSRTLNGQPEISGFAADMGRLPSCLRELLTQRDCDNSYDLATWSQDADSAVWSGWRGPYLAGNTETSGISHFRDAYGNSGAGSTIGSADWQNSGWDFNSTGGGITITSLGFDSVAATDDISTTLTAADYQVTLGRDWQTVSVEIINESANHLLIAANSLRLRLNTPEDGLILSFADTEIDTPAERDTAIYFSNTFPAVAQLLPASNGDVIVGNGDSIEFTPNAELTSTDTVTLLPGMVVKYKDGATDFYFKVSENCSPDCSLTIPPTNSDAKLGISVVTSGAIDRVEFTGADTFNINQHFVDKTFSADSLAKPSFIVPTGSALSGVTVSLPLGASITLPAGASALMDDRVVFSGETITVSEPFVLAGTVVTTTTSTDSFTVPFGTTLGSAANSLDIPPSLSITSGSKSLTVVCENNGSLYDGDCTSAGNNDPVSLTLIPRLSLPVNSEAIQWSIP